MNRITLLIMAVVMMAGAGCESARAWVQKHRAAIRGTAVIAAREVGRVAASAVLQAAVGQFDKEKKADFLQGLSGALWQHAPSAINGAVVQEIVEQWTPDKPHWAEAGIVLASEFDRLKPRTPEEVQAILSAYAEGLYVEAAKAREVVQ